MVVVVVALDFVGEMSCNVCDKQHYASCCQMSTVNGGMWERTFGNFSQRCVCHDDRYA